MRLTEILKPANIKVGLEAKNKTEAISQLVSLLASNGDVKDAKKVLDSVLEREGTRTTGIGNGLAIPHGKTPGADKLVMAIGKCTPPVDFQAIDGRPVTWICLLSSPTDQTGPHIQALAAVARLMGGDKVRAQLAQAKTPDDVYQAIVAHEAAK